MKGESEREVICRVVGIEMNNNNIMYRVCSTCETTLPQNPTYSNSFCKHCKSYLSKRLFRLLMSIATDTKVFVVIMFDRAARVLFGCSADNFFDFCNLHPFAAKDAAEVIVGEMLKVTLSKPKNGNAQHQRVVSILPLRSGFRPSIEELRELYKVKKHGKQGDISQSHAQFDFIGLKIVQVNADGNCIFRSLADQLEGNEEEHEKYSSMVVLFIVNNREMFEPFIEDEVPFYDYCQTMGRDGTWA